MKTSKNELIQKDRERRFNIFIERANKKFNGKYKYFKEDFVNKNTHMRILCPIHGIVKQTPETHLHGCGCPKCSKVQLWETRGKKTTEEFIKESIAIHHKLYDYSEVIYQNPTTIIYLTCNICGHRFPITPNKHLMGRGCPECAKVKRGLKRRITQEDYIDRATKRHKGKYSYKNTIYNGWDNDVTITCPIHGDFEQHAGRHLQGCGCPHCNQSKLEINVLNLLKQNKFTFETQKKFDWLVYEKQLKLDFYIPEYKVAIECQGQQHFFPVDFCSKGMDDAKERFEKGLKRDFLKRQLCEEHGIKLLYYSNLGIEYPYHVFEDLDELLTKIRG